jgi:hypothetical protein
VILLTTKSTGLRDSAGRVEPSGSALSASARNAAQHAATLAWDFKEKFMSLGTILLIVLILMLVGALPTWPHSRSWGYAPMGGLGLVVLIVVVLLLLGKL